MNEQSTSMLVDLHLRDDASAFTTLMRRYQERVFRLCFHLLGHREDAEDATQETFTRVARHLDHWDSSRPLEPWLMAIAGNRCRTLRARRRNLLPLAEVGEPSSSATLHQQHADQLQEELNFALEGLRDEHRQAFLFFHHHHLSYAEIAQRMECPLGTVKTWVHRARMQLIESLRAREALGSSEHAL